MQNDQSCPVKLRCVLSLAEYKDVPGHGEGMQGVRGTPRP
jgi:hypothetical protein